MSASLPRLIRSSDEVTPEWLTSVLRYAGLAQEARVVGANSQTVGTGQMGSSFRYALACDRHENGIPRSVVCKFASNDPISRSTGVALRTYEVEVNFYRQLACTVDIRTPACHFADIDLDTGEFVLVLEDLTPCAQGDQLAGCSADQAALAMQELAGLHAPRWADPVLAHLEWLNRNSPEALAMTTQLLPGLLPGFLERYGSRLEPEYQRLAVLLMENIDKWFQQRQEPFAVQHGDYRLDNMLFGTAEGGYPLAVVDWQTVTWGPPLSDASYFIGAGLTVEARRKHERPLLRLYYEALRARGIDQFSWDRCWADYRRYSFAGLLMAIGASMMVVQTERGDEMFMTMARRHGAQILDLEAQEFLVR